LGVHLAQLGGNWARIWAKSAKINFFGKFDELSRNPGFIEIGPFLSILGILCVLAVWDQKVDSVNLVKSDQQ
jgi:hypothetical protein